MRVWRINEHDWVAGPTLLSALRGARKQTSTPAQKQSRQPCPRWMKRT